MYVLCVCVSAVCMILRSEQGMAGRKQYDDFLQTVLESKYEDGTSPTEEDIRAEVDTFMVRILCVCVCVHTCIPWLALSYRGSVRRTRHHVCRSQRTLTYHNWCLTSR